MLAILFSKVSFYFAAQACTIGNNSFFGFPHWWKYLDTERDPLGKCVPAFNFPGDTWAVGLAIIDMLLRFAGLAAVISIIIAGISYITASGNSDQITSARKRIINSLLGLALAITAAAIVSFIGNKLG